MLSTWKLCVGTVTDAGFCPLNNHSLSDSSPVAPVIGSENITLMARGETVSADIISGVAAYATGTEIETASTASNTHGAIFHDRILLVRLPPPLGNIAGDEIMYI